MSPPKVTSGSMNKPKYHSDIGPKLYTVSKLEILLSILFTKLKPLVPDNTRICFYNSFMKHYNITLHLYSSFHSRIYCCYFHGKKSFKMKLLFWLFLTVIFNVIDNSMESEDNYRVLRLEDIMPSASTNMTYDKSKPPTFRAHPAIVFMHITVLMLDSFDQNEMTFTSGVGIQTRVLCKSTLKRFFVFFLLSFFITKKIENIFNR